MSGFRFSIGAGRKRPPEDDGNAAEQLFLQRKRMGNTDSYFDRDDDEDEETSVYAPESVAEETKSDEEEEDDPLDAFMAQMAKSEKKKEEKRKEQPKIRRADFEDEDDQESYFKYVESVMVPYDDDDEHEDCVEYDVDGNPIYKKPKIIEPLPPVDHTSIDYSPFEKVFYEEHKEIKALSWDQVFQLRKKLGIKVGGASVPKPCISFAHFGFDENLMKSIRKSEFSQPTSIQSQAIPAGLSGRDIIGIAKTGSGKTVAYLWPMLVHIMDQPELQEGDGPIGLICAPTRELCQQIYVECRKYGKAYGLKVCAVYGGGSKWEQTKALKEWPEIVVATPGRLIDHVKGKSTSLTRVTYLVFDEADRMFDMGFEPQVRSIANHVRPERQTMLFSATFKKKVERLARDALTDPVRIVIGDLGEANQDITQRVHVFSKQEDKQYWLHRNLVELTSAGSVLIFVTKKADSENVATNLKSKDFEIVLLHGDMDQNSRDEVITKFKKKQVTVMVATDVAARGLDIPHIKTVINYDVARDITTHTHRIGRTGRAGEKGTAFTLLNATKDVHFSADLVRNMEQANQAVPEALLELAVKDPKFKKTRFKRGGIGFGVKKEGGGSTALTSAGGSADLASPPPGPPTSRGRGRGRGFGGAGLGYTGKSSGMAASVGYQPEGSSSASTKPSIGFKSGGMLSTVAGKQSAASGRLSSLKAAYGSTYGRFQRSTDGDQTMSTGASSDKEKKRKSRWT
ncbi:ATP-dependent RNA helicase DDX42-like [Oscarella lobularis]|uniref:ATP-dependent RNA helicase DDX42-like n=1 Tax=Oscarella lobularis TaxID=121494 RepID=UPI003313E2BB